MDPDQQHGQSLSEGLNWSTPSLRMGVRDPVDTTVQDMTRSKALGLTTIYEPLSVGETQRRMDGFQETTGSHAETGSPSKRNNWP